MKLKYVSFNNVLILREITLFNFNLESLNLKQVVTAGIIWYNAVLPNLFAIQERAFYV